MAKIRSLQASPSYVDCVNGYVSGGTLTTCADECSFGGLNCCEGIEACTGFSCRVYSGSCVGFKACYKVFIQTVVNSCVGEGACYGYWNYFLRSAV
jgi:hypothetical protein